jgi:hypothetical protein
MRVLVCGGRGYDNAVKVNNALNKLADKHGVSMVIQGAARGADALARKWAENHGVEVKSFPADWGTHGKSAGPMRNQAMLSYGQPDMVVAFPGGRGTADMIEKAKVHGVPVWEPYS